MNKYSSKAIKTAATVGMSLAMVLSAAAPVMAATAPVSGNVCKTTDDDLCKSVFRLLKDAIGDDSFANYSMDDSKEVDINGTKYNLVRAAVYYNAGLNKHSATLSDSEWQTLRTWNKVVKPIVEMFGTANTEDAKTLDGEVAEIKTNANATDTDGKLGMYNTYLEGGDWTKATLENNAALVTAAVKAWNELEVFEDSESYGMLSEDFQTKFDGVKDKLEKIVTPYTDSDDEITAKFVDAWTKVLEYDLSEKTEKLTLTTDEAYITGLTTSESPISLNNKSNLSGRITSIKNSPNYYQVKLDENVINIIDRYQELIDDLGTNKDLLKTDEYVAYNKTKTDYADKTVKTFLTTEVKESNDVLYTATLAKDSITVSNALADAKYIAKHIDSEQLEILKALKEEVLDVAYNFETKKVGNYYLDKSGFTTKVTNAQKTTLGKDLPAFLFKVVDGEKGTFGIDYVINYANDAQEALKAVTKGIEKLTPANIKTTDKAALEAAEDAYYELTDGKYKNNLTSSERKDVRRADAKITNLREAFDNLGVTNVAGWYDMGNGNWGYNNEDGTPAAYKWVASGSNWYMIKDGKMLRNSWLATDGGRWYYLDNAGKMVTNQSVDGCWINSYGVYMSPTYNG